LAQVPPETGDPDGFNASLKSQLQLCLASLETKQPETAIGGFQHGCQPGCSSPNFAAQGGGHEVWEAISEMIKNMSETLLSSLPNFWKIARSFIEGKFKRVRSTFVRVMIYQRQTIPAIWLTTKRSAM